MEELLYEIIDKAASMGAQYVEARYHVNSYYSLRARNGAIIDSSKEIEEGVGVRVLVDGALGFASTSRLDRDSLLKTVEEAVAKARFISKYMKKPLSLGPGRVGYIKYEATPRIPFSNISLDDKIGTMKELWEISRKSVREASVKVLFTELVESIEEKIIVTSEGAYVRSNIPRLYLSYNIVVNLPSKGTVQRWEEYGGSGGYELMKKWRVDEEVGRETSTLERILLEAREPPKEPVEVIVGSEIVGLIAHESAGHPSEADRILGREAAQAGMSYIKKGMSGTRIGNENATVVDDPTIPGSYGFFLYDDEGVAARPKYLYKEGLIYEHMHNRFTAAEFGVESNGSARAMNYASEPIIRMSNTYLTPGDYTLEELIEDVELGVYIKSYMEWNIDDERWSQRYVGLEAYLIERGEVKGLVRNPVLELSTKAFYSSIVGKTKELRFYAGTCGKGEPSQGVPVWFGGPDVKLSKMKLGVAPE
ncbi:TldD/PmbA family protein [Thermogladius sp. 4427co]|uniref:TldD/PmbA family protein n=1 Tax=Thermogladius sp. 4427co TaxID=3450718 RepID=UPI003F7AA4A1